MNRFIASTDVATPPLVGKIHTVDGGSVTTVATTVGSHDIVVADASDFSVGSYVVMYNTDIKRFYVGYVLAINTNTLTMDSPIDAMFPVGSLVGSSETNMAVDGSVTEQVFGIRGTASSVPFQQAFDVTRILIHCETTGAVSLDTFGDIAGGITNGLVLRVRSVNSSGETEYRNVFNVKTNGELAGITLDWNPYEADNPVQGQNGFTARLTFSGSDKLGTIIRLRPGEDLEFIVQDNLSTLQVLEVVAEGHVSDLEDSDNG